MDVFTKYLQNINERLFLAIWLIDSEISVVKQQNKTKKKTKKEEKNKFFFFLPFDFNKYKHCESHFQVKHK